MKIIEVNTGKKAAYSLEKELLKIESFTFDLNTLQRDYPVAITIYRTEHTLSLEDGDNYAAEILIPAKQYILVRENDIPENEPANVRLPSSWDNLELKLWRITDDETL